MLKVDAIVVGLGLAGAVLCRQLLLRHKKIVVFDPNPPHSSSRIAAGLTNPITGRRFVLSWRFEELSDYARKFYQSWGADIGQEVIQDIRMIRLLEDHRFANDIDAKVHDEMYATYLSMYHENLPDFLRESDVGYTIHGAFRVFIHKLIDDIRKRRQVQVIDESFDHQRMELSDHEIRYGSIRADHLYFCEGASAVDNPYFEQIAFQLTKGEILEIALPRNFPSDVAYKHQLTLLQMYDFLWVGALSYWDFYDDQPTTEGERLLIAKLKKQYRPDLYIHRHLAAIRPTIRDRRPVIGRHPDFNRLCIFNGLGTKGCLMSPYFAGQLLDHVYENSPLDSEVDVRRFYRVL